MIGKHEVPHITELGEDPVFNNTVGDVLDKVIKEIRATHAGVAALQFAALVAQTDVIKAPYPKS